MHKQFREQAIKLRKDGKTYKEICGLLDVKIPKSTLSGWCKDIPLPSGYGKKLTAYKLFTLQKARKFAVIAIHKKIERKIERYREINRHLPDVIKSADTAKIALAMLYLGEGGKNVRHCLYFGNSDPLTIGLFLSLLRRVYKLDEKKFRCTVQCRADQNIQKLEHFWANITKIPLNQFYEARIDPRTVDKPSKKLEYKGVCRIDYFSADIVRELLEIPKIIMGL
ncbi:MAG: hypothetical protein L7H18_05175 [Candidatus Nealsonbacteria bacterium DGGOD1a]|nr:MAG: hypothetical protein L7H18_05175 [Candidatus Nealsonbacteria bacterium DGGOD1a]